MEQAFAVVVPALERNSYHEKGDLAPFGDTTLLEWKLSQVREVVPLKNIYVTTPSNTIKNLVNRQGYNVILRDEEFSFEEMVAYTVEQLNSEKSVLWANPSVPFVSGNDYLDMIERYNEVVAEGYDSLFGYYDIQEYVFFNDAPLNFELGRFTSRREVKKLEVVNTGGFIIDRTTLSNRHTMFGVHPYHYPLDRFSAMEIREVKDYVLASHLIAYYFTHQELML